jgi:hypothetical protein
MGFYIPYSGGGNPIVNSSANWMKNIGYDVDISSIVGSRKVMCYIEIRPVTVGGGAFCLQPKGIGTWYPATADTITKGMWPFGKGSAAIATDSNSNSRGILTMTDSSGTLTRWGSQTGPGLNAEAYLHGYFIPTDDTTRGVYVGNYNSGSYKQISFPAGPATNVDTFWFAMVKPTTHETSSGYSYESEPYWYQPPGESYEYKDYYYHYTGPPRNVYGWPEGVFSGGLGAHWEPSETWMETGYPMFYEAGSSYIVGAKNRHGSGGTTPDLDMLCYEQEKFTVMNLALWSGTGHTEITWGSNVLDLSPYIQAQRALCWIRVTNTGAGSSKNTDIAIRPYDLGREWLDEYVHEGGGGGCNSTRIKNQGVAHMLVCPTDANGKIDMHVTYEDSTDIPLQFTLAAVLPSQTIVASAPTVENIYPQNLSIHTTSLPRVQFDIVSAIGVKISSVNLFATDPLGTITNIIVAGSVQSGFDGYLASLEMVGANPGRLRVTVNIPDLATHKDWIFGLNAETALGGAL